MNKKRWIVLIIILVVILIIGVIFLTKIVNLRQKANRILGKDYCTGNHYITAGDALTPWTCELCGYSDINPDTDEPVICNKCANLTKRCMKCGKLEK